MNEDKEAFLAKLGAKDTGLGFYRGHCPACDRKGQLWIDLSHPHSFHCKVCFNRGNIYHFGRATFLANSKTLRNSSSVKNRTTENSESLVPDARCNDSAPSGSHPPIPSTTYSGFIFKRKQASLYKSAEAASPDSSKSLNVFSDKPDRSETSESVGGSPNGIPFANNQNKASAKRSALVIGLIGFIPVILHIKFKNFSNKERR